LLIDVSIIASHDAGTGIQRVVRSLLLQLLAAPPEGFEIKPVRATRKQSFKYANLYLASLTNETGFTRDDDVQATSGDIFLGLDLTSRITPRRHLDFLKWRVMGVRCVFVVYDVLPLLQPHRFTPSAQRSFRHWASLLAIHADALFCISNSVAFEVRDVMRDRFGLTQTDLPISWFHLGADLPTETIASRGASSAEEKTVLMVGTIEPRKGHSQVLDALELLWRDGVQAHLTMVGRPGWRMETFVDRLRHHPELNARLHWLNDADDAQLACCYSRADGLIMASEAEGFGLPLIEAAHYGAPIFARDIPVFREVAGVHATYFSAQDGADLAPQLRDWLNDLADGAAPPSRNMNYLSWKQSAEKLKELIVGLDGKVSRR
jgi:glycosyltransferase involved in cell wall biosynthesis